MLLVIAMVVPGCSGPIQADRFPVTMAVAPAGAGTATFTGSSPFTAGSTVSITAVPGGGQKFVGWTSADVEFDNAAAAATFFVMPEKAVTVTANFEARDGFWLDSITIEKEGDRIKAVERLAAGDFDIYAHTLTDASLFAIVDADPNLYFKSSIGSFNTLRVNPYGPLFTDGTLNPFHYPEMIETLHKFVDREFIANDVMAGLAWPRYTSQHTQLADYARYFDATHIAAESSIQFLEDKYDFDESEGMTWLMAAIDVINADPDVPGTVAFEDGKFLYDGEQVEMIIAIRSDDPVRDQIGDYVGAQLEKMGFKFTPFKGNMAATLSGLANVKEQIEGGGWNIYTGGWVSTVLSRDSGYWFLYFHTGFWSGGIPAFASLEVPDDYFDAAMALAWLDFSSFAERDAAYELCLPEHMKYGMVHLVDSRGFSPLRTNTDVAADKAGGIYGSWMWAFTAHFRGSAPQFGGDMKIAMHDLLVEPWNPIAGSNTVYDMFPIRATGDMGTHPDTNTGLRWAGRIDSAEVTVTTGLPVIATNPWVELKFAPTITAPGDAWRGWDPVTQTPITVAQALANPDEPWGLSDAGVARYSVAYYPADIWDHPLHDGSTLSFADFLYGWFMDYERGQEASPLFDEAAQSTLVNSVYPNTVGVKFTVNPSPGVGLKVEEWSQLWELDAERMIATGYPNYAQGNGFWHTIALGILEERAGNMAFGETKAQGTSLGWISFLNRDVQLGAFSSRLNAIRAATTYTDANVPFYDFIKAQYAAQGAGNFDAEIGSRMDNLRGWVDTMNHLWVGSGPYYLDNYNFALSWVRIKPFEAYPDSRDRWLFLLQNGS